MASTFSPSRNSGAAVWRGRSCTARNRKSSGIRRRSSAKSAARVHFRTVPLLMGLAARPLSFNQTCYSLIEELRCAGQIRRIAGGVRRWLFRAPSSSGFDVLTSIKSIAVIFRRCQSAHIPCANCRLRIAVSGRESEQHGNSTTRARQCSHINMSTCAMMYNMKPTSLNGRKEIT